jgi:hypothetical protein
LDSEPLRCERKDGPEAFLDAVPERLQSLCGWKGWKAANGSDDPEVQRLEALLEEAHRQQAAAGRSGAPVKVSGSVSAAAAVAAYEASLGKKQ